MTTDILIVFCIIVLAAAFFVWGKIRSDIVALCALVSLMFFGMFFTYVEVDAETGREVVRSTILTVSDGLSGFSNSVVVMMACLFIVGGGIFQTGLARMISTKILAFAGKSELKLFILVMLVTGGIGGFVSNTGTVALMLPIAMSLAMEAKTDSRRFLMPMAFASSLGMITLISTPPNLIINEALIDAGFEGLSFFAFLPVGAITLTLGIVLLWHLSKFLIVKKEDADNVKKNAEKSLKQLEQEYQLADSLYRVKVEKGSYWVNKKLQDLNITQMYHVSILAIRKVTHSQFGFHKSEEMCVAGPDSLIGEGDVLYIFGKYEYVKSLVADNQLSLVDMHESEARSVSEIGGLKFKQIGIAEVVLLSTSKLINKPVKDSGFRQLYNVNILGIQRQDEYIVHDVKDVKMLAGDVLLVQGQWSNIDRLSQETSEWVVVGQPMENAAKVPLDHKAPIAALIMVAMVVAMVFNVVPTVMATLIAAGAMILTGCFRNVEAAYKTINWESIFLFAGMFPLAIAMNNTGASALIANGIVSGLDALGPVAVLAGVYLATSILTMFISNTATAVLFAPIGLQTALTLGVSPYPFLFAVTVAASMCFASPFATPPNALVMSAGRYKFMDYIRVGLPLQVIVGIVMIVVLPLLFPL